MSFFRPWRPWWKRKKEEYTGPKHRIVKEEWSNGTVRFFIEEYTYHYACNDPFWLVIDTSNGGFHTHEEASTFLTKILTPPEKPIFTVVEER